MTLLIKHESILQLRKRLRNYKPLQSVALSVMERFLTMMTRNFSFFFYDNLKQQYHTHFSNEYHSKEKASDHKQYPKNLIKIKQVLIHIKMKYLVHLLDFPLHTRLHLFLVYTFSPHLVLPPNLEC